MWNFSLNFPHGWENLRIHCFPGSLLMRKCCSHRAQLYFLLSFTSVYSQRKNLHSVLIQEQKCRASQARDLLLLQPSQTPHRHRCCERISCRTEKITSDAEFLLHCSQRKSICGPCGQTQTFLLPAQSCPSPVYILLALGPTFNKKE